MDSFERALKTYVQVDDELKRLLEEAKQLRKNKTDLESRISTHMVENDMGEHPCADSSRVKVYTKKSTKNFFNRAGVYECTQELFGPDNADKLIARIDEKKQISESTSVKRLGVR